MWRPRFIGVSLLTGLLIFPLCLAASAAEKELVIATSTMGGAFYPIGGKMAALWSRTIPGTAVTAQVTAGGVENARLISQDKVELAIIPSDMAFNAVEGKPPFVDKDKKPKPIDLGFMVNLNPSVVHFVVLKESPFNSVRDLKGKRVAVGAAGSAVEVRSRILLEAYGYKYDRDVKPVFLGAEESTQVLKDGLADAVCLTAGIPTAAVMDIATFKPIKLIPLDEEVIAKVLKEHPYLMRFTIPKNAYKGIDQECITVANTGQLYASPRLDPGIVYQMTKAMFDNAAEVQASHGSMKDWNKDFAVALKVSKFHPGAEKYLKEAGLIK
jgi:TRAP transporter TAXI family solute receptor